MRIHCFGNQASWWELSFGNQAKNVAVAVVALYAIAMLTMGLLQFSAAIPLGPFGVAGMIFLSAGGGSILGIDLIAIMIGKCRQKTISYPDENLLLLQNEQTFKEKINFFIQHNAESRDLKAITAGEFDKHNIIQGKIEGVPILASKKQVGSDDKSVEIIQVFRMDSETSWSLTFYTMDREIIFTSNIRLKQYSLDYSKENGFFIKEDCPINFATMQLPFQNTTCHHLAEAVDLRAWATKNPTCPCCKGPINGEDLEQLRSINRAFRKYFPEETGKRYSPE